jgi:hypothetical protein
MGALGRGRVAKRVCEDGGQAIVDPRGERDAEFEVVGSAPHDYVRGFANFLSPPSLTCAQHNTKMNLHLDSHIASLPYSITPYTLSTCVTNNLRGVYIPNNSPNFQIKQRRLLGLLGYLSVSKT